MTAGEQTKYPQVYCMTLTREGYGTDTLYFVSTKKGKVEIIVNHAGKGPNKFDKAGITDKSAAPWNWPDSVVNLVMLSEEQTRELMEEKGLAELLKT